MTPTPEDVAIGSSGFTRQKPFVAIDSDISTAWNGHSGGVHFLCGVCLVRFAAGDVVRWIYAAGSGMHNFFVCAGCDGPDAIARAKGVYFRILAQAKALGIYCEGCQ